MRLTPRSNPGLGAFRRARWRTACAAAAIVLAGACSIQMKSLTRGGAQAPRAGQCGECHVDIYRDWRQSPHARAWTSPTFAEEALAHQVKECLPCHAPGTAFSPAGQFKLREAHRDEGVTCIACHLIDGKQHGPYTAGPVTPHATEADAARYQSPEICGNCHEGAYAAWKASRAAGGDVLTCQQCHMPAAHGKLTQATGMFSAMIVKLHKEHDLKRHTFATPAPAERPAAQLAFRLEPGAAVVTARNLLPHAIPEGDFGFRRAVLTARVLDSEGRPLHSVSRDFRKALKTQLDPGKSAELRLPLPERGSARIEARLERLDQDGHETRVIADSKLELKPGEGTGAP